MMFSSAIRVSLFSVKSVMQSAAELFYEIMSWPWRNGQASEAKILDRWHHAAYRLAHKATTRSMRQRGEPRKKSPRMGTSAQ